ncbi:MAG: LysM peptidoglycan-binding domain-containing protein [Luteolibacter sp.]
MKPHTLPVKRRPAPQGIFKRLSAVTRKQRVAATATADMEIEDSGSKISRALTIIFLFHIVAIGLIFVHKQFLDGRPSELTGAKTPEKSQSLAAVAPSAARADLPRLASGERPYIVRAGDNYSRIAVAEGVDEGDLRLINKHVDIGPGLILKVPPKRIVAVESPEVTAIRNSTPVDRDQGLVEVDVKDAPRAQLVRPNIHPAVSAPKASTASHADAPKVSLTSHTTIPVSNNPAPVSASGKTYQVQQGDSVWRIANRFKVSQDQLMRANGISDARKIKPGMSLAIPK